MSPGRLWRFGAPGSVDSVRVGALGRLAAAEAVVGFWSFCPSTSSSSQLAFSWSSCGGAGGGAALRSWLRLLLPVACTGGAPDLLLPRRLGRETTSSSQRCFAPLLRRRAGTQRPRSATSRLHRHCRLNQGSRRLREGAAEAEQRRVSGPRRRTQRSGSGTGLYFFCFFEVLCTAVFR